MRRRLLVLAALALAGAGCSDATAPAGGGEEPAGLAFDFSGSRSGHHQSRGAAALDARGLPASGSWAAARPDSLGGLLIAGFAAGDGGKGDLFILQLHPARTGQYACTEHGQEGCHGRLFLGVDPAGLTVEGQYTVVSGSVTVTERSAQRVAGTMSLTLKNARGDETLTVENGTIDVAYRDEVTVANGVACLARNLTEGGNQGC